MTLKNYLQQKKDSATVENLRIELAKHFDMMGSRNMDADVKQCRPNPH